MRRQTTVAISILLIAITIPVLWAGAIDWIQYNERLSGEDSPFYEDIINRPAKQIYAIYTSEHHPDGTHKTFPVPDFPTPIPTVPFPTPLPTPTPKPNATPQPTPTPIPANAQIDWTNATANFMTTGTVDGSTAAAIKPKLYYQSTAPDITTDSFAFWVDSYSNQFWLILDRNGVQKKTELLP